MRTTEVFFDTAYAVALASISDQHHERALELADWVASEGIRFVTTRPVVIEIGDTLARQRYRHEAVFLLQTIEQEPNIEVVPLSQPLYNEALALYQSRQDKEWGMTDCISFIVMQHRGVTEALTADVHFRQAGFSALLIDNPN